MIWHPLSEFSKAADLFFLSFLKQKNRRLTGSFRADTATKRAELANLSTQPVTFTATRCSACGAGLDLPTVHFMCKHSFHQRCLNVPTGAADGRSRRFSGGGIEDALDSIDINNNYYNNNSHGDGDDNDNVAAGNEADGADEVECPVCAPQNATVRAIRKAQEESAGRHDMFLDALGRSKDGFGTVSEWFGRGVMNNG